MIETGSLIRSLSGRPAARNFHNFVINEIGLSIVTGAFPVGSTLSSDQVMMETYGVSRTVLREALKTLEAKGLVEARPKVGTRVSPISRWNFFDPQVLSWHYYAKPDARFYESLFDVRRSLGTRSASLAAQRRTADNVRVMKYWLHQIELNQTNPEGHGLACLEIHRAIAEASGNSLLRSVTGVVELTIALAIKANSSGDTNGYFTHGLLSHHALIAAVEKSDPEAAQDAASVIINLDNEQVVRLLTAA
ncbi:FadR/GntR family transcriptional regulator [Devosia sp. MC1541]|uniref:FadR/GntR family transcriptional regulator n=1 Tax=Devosia sp. MC1541 TaxID=2725264 RepID=UPI00145C4F2E|nr:FadR/GntR family transcriptional regulator [Devosia sp. MC1541]